MIFIPCLPFLLLLLSSVTVSSKRQHLDELLQNRSYDRRTRPFEDDEKLEKVNYDKLNRPDFDKGVPLNVTNQIFILKLTAINEHDFTYGISYFIRQWWRDPRLASIETTQKVTYHRDPHDLIWLPDLTLTNSDQNKLIEDNVATVIDHEGNVFTSQRKKALCSCIMDLSFYPMDTQFCPFILESYAYSDKDVRLDWHTQPLDHNKNLELSGYYLVDIIHERVAKSYTVGNSTESHDNLVLTFIVRRTFLYYLYRAYIPIMLLMVFNIGSYWVPDTALPARVTLIVTTFLTNVFILQSVSEQTVRVSSTTSLQVFVVVNIFMIVVAIIEYLTVLHLKSKKKRKRASHDMGNNYDMNTINSRHDSICYHAYDLSPVQAPQQTTTPTSNTTTTNEIHTLDVVFRFVTPVVYFVFCCVYFGYYLGYGKQSK